MDIVGQISLDEARHLIASRKIDSIADYLTLYRDVNRMLKGRKSQCKKNIRIALLSSFTIEAIKEILFIKCCELGVVPEVYVAGYDQYHQEILNEHSGLYEFNPDLIILFIDIKKILGEQYSLPYQFSNEERLGWVKNQLKEIESLIQTLKSNSSACILFHNFEIPIYSPLGVLENRQQFGIVEAVQNLNIRLRDFFKNDARVFLFDYDSFCSEIGKQNVMDYKMYYLADMKLAIQHMPKLCDKYLAYIKSILFFTKKCIVLDLDNTLWGGILGEDGLEGIEIGATPQGKPFLEVQKFLLALFQRGIILAINSKNNFDEAMTVFRQHPDMILREEHFAAMQINWRDKVSNMKDIAEDLKIGMDSFVFIDDEKYNREMVKEFLPEIHVVDLPEDPALYLSSLVELNDFNVLDLSEEDKKRGSIYAQQRKRKEFQRDAANIKEYFEGLEMVATIEKGRDFSIPRIAQLTQKTNQFNMTTRRYSNEDIRKFLERESSLVATVRIRDRFGDNGICGVVIVDKQSGQHRIDTFLLSCRVVGRGIESVLLGYVLDQLRKNKIDSLLGEFISTSKNAPAKDFYKDNGFNFIGKENEKEVWEYILSRPYETPSFINVIKE